MNFKKVLITLLALLVVSSAFVGCGSSNDEINNSSDDKKTEERESGLSENKENSPNRSKTNKTLGDSPEEFIENIGDVVDLGEYEQPDFDEYGVDISLIDDKYFGLSNSVTFKNGGTIEIGMTVSEVIEQGWTCEFDDIDSLDSMTSIALDYYNKAGEVITLHSDNDGDESISLLDSVVSIISLDIRELCDGVTNDLNIAPTFTVEGEITNNSSVYDVVNALGYPSYIDYSVYESGDEVYVEYDDDDSLYEFTFSAKDNCILEVTIF